MPPDPLLRYTSVPAPSVFVFEPGDPMFRAGEGFLAGWAANGLPPLLLLLHVMNIRPAIGLSLLLLLTRPTVFLLLHFASSLYVASDDSNGTT
jgi:hypothetical protein